MKFIVKISVLMLLFFLAIGCGNNTYSRDATSQPTAEIPTGGGCGVAQGLETTHNNIKIIGGL